MQHDSIDSEKLPEHLQPFFDPAFYPHPVQEIRMLQTHISWVFLTGDFAYKLKKSVNFGFLDFTTLPQRKKACYDEFSLNRRLAPDLYLDVLPIQRLPIQPAARPCGKAGYRIAESPGHGSEDGSNTVDYCLKMVQFDQDDLFDVRVESNRFEPEWMDQLAVTVAEFHRTAECNAKIEAFGEPQFLYHHIQENLHVADEHLRILKLSAPLAGLKRKIEHCFQASKQQLSMRQSGHHIRNCHGDLHLKNITLFNNRPTPFDCIEFSDEFRMIDTMNDAAFLMMDCDARKRSDLGYRFLSRYLEQTGDYEGLQLLYLYLSYRAGVRGKVACLSADNPALPPDELSKLSESAQHYFTLASDYLNAKQPQLFIIGGLSGSGKSHLALLGLQHEKAIVIRSDATRKRIARHHSELSLYGEKMHRLTYQAMFAAASSALTAGFSVILDATFLHPGSRDSAMQLATKLSVPARFCWLDIAEGTLRKRVKRRHADRSDISDADLNVLEKQLQAYRRPTESYIRFLQESGIWPER